MRIAVAGFSHETNSFALERNDQLDAQVAVGQEIVERAHPKSFVGGFLEAAREGGSDVEVVPTVQVHPVHGGLIGAGTFEHYRDQIVAALRREHAAGALDGVYLALHGAMTAEAPYTDGEGALLAAVRQAVPEVPIVATYDFHAIMSDQECAVLAAAFPNDTNPHVDGYERGREAAECLVRTVRGQLHPVTRHVAIPIVGPNIGQSTWNPVPEAERRLPLYQLNLIRAEMERRTPGIINLTILGGYGYADTPDTAMAVVATADGDPQLAQQTARELARQVWARRQDILDVRPIVPVDEGVRRAMELTASADRPPGPLVLVDLGDDPGSACPADSPVVLEALLRLGARDCAVTLRDAPAVAACHRAGVGATLTIEVGASIDRRFYQPLRVTGAVKSLDDGVYTICGPTHGGWGREVTREAWREARVGPRAVLRVGDKIDVVLSQESTGKDRDFFKSTGILMEEKRIIAVKSNQAHRASFDSIAAGTIDLATPGVSTVDYASLPFKHLKRPMWPLDRDFDWDG
ncbi:MAG TPA: M81 family metallopeptidase [Chloroflexota bacterium]|nr:M81 family metallopeptidase [Chloroflexota bacterium]